MIIELSEKIKKKKQEFANIIGDFNEAWKAVEFLLKESERGEIGEIVCTDPVVIRGHKFSAAKESDTKFQVLFVYKGSVVEVISIRFYKEKEM